MFLVWIMTGIIIGIIICLYWVDHIERPNFEAKNNEIDRYIESYMLMNHWVILKQNGDFVVSYFKDRSISKIVIYGLTELGARLYDELKNSEISVLCMADSSFVVSPYPEVPLLNPDMFSDSTELKEAEAIVITPTYAFEDIKQMLIQYTDCPIISIKVILDTF